ncbi:hypothetical protein L202_00694 [Cryptococcus amylolentus CBS 6039]|uniref:Mitochondrial DNA polymerase catalytic subunit n=1 Tax=Cryptococcus amylolentus CBS 6039 TaxID=1295533 RepID=A0A1E3I801_9TREE|nr:hypothetical protein L202_00694 [Cryptococcus amylolentus CBS 6039]ODN84833.1 hypothetical protein L202_00694 [Cryptococcus amylolentus CBS 6039]
MLAARTLEVCRLPRPDRLRVSARWASSARSSGSSPSLSNAISAQDPSFGPKRAELDDYRVALKEDVKPRRIRRARPALPSLYRLDSFDGSGSALPSSGHQSRKGKEKELPVLGLAETKETQAPQSAVTVDMPNGSRRNPVGVQMLSSSLHSQLFPGAPLPKPPESLLAISKRHLQDNGLSPEGAAVLPDISFEMPALRGKDIREHFAALGQHVAEPYASMANDLVNVRIPEKPAAWEVNKAGWTKYYSDGRTEAVDDLGDETLVSFDVETLYKLSKFPVMATAASPDHWYSWLSSRIFEDLPDTLPEKSAPYDISTPDCHPNELIPLFPKSSPTPRLVIGHNVGYDRARIKEEYFLERTSTRYLDTLALHVATRGITSVQRPAWMAYRKNKKAKTQRDQDNLDVLQEYAQESGDYDLLASLQGLGATSETEADTSNRRWEEVTSMNSLAEVASLHCKYPVDKSVRDRFGDDAIKHASQLRSELQDLLTYCADDVRITHDVYRKVYPLFLESCPHPATLAGVLIMGNSFLPVDQSWKEYLKNAETTYREMDDAVKKALRLLAEKVKADGPKEDDPWISQLDWTPKNARWADGTVDGNESAVPEASLDAVNDTAVEAVPPSATVEADTNSPPASRGATVAPAWLSDIVKDDSNLGSNVSQRYLFPLILRLSYKDHPVVYLSEHGWCFMVPQERLTEYIAVHGDPVASGDKDRLPGVCEHDNALFRIGGYGSPKKVKLHGPSNKKLVTSGELTSPYPEVLNGLVGSADVSPHLEDLRRCVEDLQGMKESVWGQQLDWSLKDVVVSSTPEAKSSKRAKSPKKREHINGSWPKWYWDLTGPAHRIPPGQLDLTCKKSVAPLLLRLQWQGFPLFASKEHKWLYRMSKSALQKDPLAKARGEPVVFGEKDADFVHFHDPNYVFFRLPHKDGEGNNVGNPLSKNFVKPIESGELASAAAGSEDDVAARAATDATTMNAFCSYWISSRERIMDQMVVYRDENFGMILPQVITMGTVTRRAVEATWLTASNAKKNRVGSELKAMVRAPPGYSIVGADVDSEELWISSVMGDSQFGVHGATAIGWMTLEGTKSAGTDLHSKTANILGISRDAAKVFNYSRIYGAGKKHAVQLLLQGDSNLTKEAAGQLADNLYKSTKGAKAMRSKQKLPAAVPSLWHGGSESYLFNTLEAIALSERPMTPALGCGVTRALRKSYLEEGSSYLPSRVNWVVQSSGVDYLHLLIVSMEYLLHKYDIKARYLISVHDEVRYLAKEEDRYRTAMALQIANAWTRALFCYNLGIDDMPQGIAFFSAVDVDHILRKEVFLTCETPSHKVKIAPGESLDINQLLEKVAGGSLGPAKEDDLVVLGNTKPPIALFPNIQSDNHRKFLEAQANRRGHLARGWLDSLTPIVQATEGAAKRPWKQGTKKPVSVKGGASA